MFTVVQSSLREAIRACFQRRMSPCIRHLFRFVSQRSVAFKRALNGLMHLDADLRSYLEWEVVKIVVALMKC